MEIAAKRIKKGTESVKQERRRLKTSGKEHTTYKNKVISAKQCSRQEILCKCKFECKSLSNEYKTILFNNFYACDKAKHGTYLLGNIQVGRVNLRRNGSYEDPSESRRQCTIYYTIPNEQGEHIRVCRKMFENIFDLSHKHVQVLTEKKKRGDHVYVDKRGKHNKPRKFNDIIRSQVCEHIKSFFVEENHYSRKMSSKQYLSPVLNINRLYTAFKNENPNTIITYRYYADVFHQDFKHLRFGRPRSDTCSTCNLYKNKIKVNPRDAASVKCLELHQRKAEKPITTMKQDKILSQEPTNSLCNIAADLQQVLFVPTLTHSQMFYSRQLSCYNFGIHVANTDDAYMCMWDETIAGRGGNEIASCILKTVLDENLAIHGNKQLIIWTENCMDQNKNRMMIFALILLVSTGMFDEIHHKFLVSGHSYMACDRDFALIEKRKRVCKSYTPMIIQEMVKQTRQNNPFKIIQMQPDNFKNLQDAADHYINTNNLNISKVSWLKICKDDPTKIMTKKTFGELEPWIQTSVLKKDRTKKDLSHITLKIIAYDYRSHISIERINNLRDMIPYIPKEHLAFYEELCNT